MLIIGLSQLRRDLLNCIENIYVILLPVDLFYFSLYIRILPEFIFHFFILLLSFCIPNVNYECECLSNHFPQSFCASFSCKVLPSLIVFYVSSLLILFKLMLPSDLLL